MMCDNKDFIIIITQYRPPQFQVAGLSYGSSHSVGLRAARRVPLRRTSAAVVSRPDRCSPHCVIGLGIPHCRPSPPNFSQLTAFRISKTVDELPAASTSSQLVIPLSMVEETLRW